LVKLTDKKESDSRDLQNKPKKSRRRPGTSRGNNNDASDSNPNRRAIVPNRNDAPAFAKEQN